MNELERMHFFVPPPINYIINSKIIRRTDAIPIPHTLPSHRYFICSAIIAMRIINSKKLSIEPIATVKLYQFCMEMIWHVSQEKWVIKSFYDFDSHVNRIRSVANFYFPLQQISHTTAHAGIRRNTPNFYRNEFYSVAHFNGNGIVCCCGVGTQLSKWMCEQVTTLSLSLSLFFPSKRDVTNLILFNFANELHLMRFLVRARKFFLWLRSLHL